MGSENSPDSRSDGDDSGERESEAGDSASSTAAVDGSGDASTRANASADPVTDGSLDHGAGDEPVSVDSLFEILSRPGNRYVLSYVVREDGPVPYHDLVEYVVDEAEEPASLTTAEFRNRIATRLVHSNLPKLDDADLVDYDAAAGTVRETEATEVAVPYLELAMGQSLTA